MDKLLGIGQVGDKTNDKKLLKYIQQCSQMPSNTVAGHTRSICLFFALNFVKFSGTKRI